MKTRQGFVSNSSSQSFIVRGIIVSKEDAISKIGAKFEDECEDEFDWDGVIEKTINEKHPDIQTGWRSDINVFPYINWFRLCDGEKPEAFVIGKRLKDAEDGDWVGANVDEKDDTKTRENLAKILDTKPENINLQTYYQFVSNDNY